MIYWTIDHYTTSEGSGDEQTVTHHGSGDLCVWFHDSDYQQDQPDRRVDSGAVGSHTQHPNGEVEPPDELMTMAVKRAVLDTASQNRPMTTRRMQIFLEAFVGEHRYVEPRETALY